MTATHTPLELRYFVPDIEDVLETYTHLRWWRSESEHGVYTPFTTESAGPAELLTPFETPYQIAGMALELGVDVTEHSHTFGTVDPTSAADAAADLAAGIAELNCVVEDNRIQIRTAASGAARVLQVLGGDAAASLGFVPGDLALGLGADTALQAGTHEYVVTDPHSAATYWYRVQFVNSVTPAYSELSTVFPADRPEGIPVSETVPCFVRLADFSGRPVQCRTVRIHNVPTPNLVQASNGDWGLFRNVVAMETDRNGYAETRLLRGAVVDLEIVGSGFVRRIQVPVDAGSVDLLDPALVLDDEFGIRHSSATPAVRTS